MRCRSSSASASRVTRAGWRGRDIQNGDEWLYRLSTEELAEIDAALVHLKATGRQIPDIAREHFPLKRFARTLRLLQTEIENGLGIMLIRGLPRDRYTLEEMASLAELAHSRDLLCQR